MGRPTPSPRAAHPMCGPARLARPSRPRRQQLGRWCTSAGTARSGPESRQAGAARAGAQHRQRRRDSGTASGSARRRAPPPRLLPTGSAWSGQPRWTAHRKRCSRRRRRAARRVTSATPAWRPSPSPVVVVADAWIQQRCFREQRRRCPASASPGAPLAHPAIACARAASAMTCPRRSSWLESYRFSGIYSQLSPARQEG